MLTESFDTLTKPIFSPANIFGEQKKLCDICLVTYSNEILRYVQENFECREIETIRACNGSSPILGFQHEGREYAIYLSSIGSAAAGATVIETNWMIGATRYIMFGSAGSLDYKLTDGKFVIPTEAYRDEGLSYHYAPPADYIRIRNSGFVEETIKALNAPYVVGKTWTTDAIYRETAGHMQKRKAEGCIAVEMEVAGIQAVCDSLGIELYSFLVTGDILDAPTYSTGKLSHANHGVEKLYMALEIAKRLQEDNHD